MTQMSTPVTSVHYTFLSHNDSSPLIEIQFVHSVDLNHVAYPESHKCYAKENFGA